MRMTAAEKQRQQSQELERIADQLEQQQFQQLYNPARSWDWMSALEIDIVEVASDMMDMTGDSLSEVDLNV